MVAPGSRDGWLAFWLASAAVAAAGAFTVWALVAPVYASGQTVLQANPEFSVRIAIATPLVLASVVWVLLRAACRFNANWARVTGATLAWLLLAFGVITGFSIGMLVLPAAGLLVLAATVTPVTRS